MTTQTDVIEELREAGLHSIFFRNAGVGIQFYEPPDGFEIEVGLGVRDNKWRDYLIVRKYYPTLEEAVNAEVARVRGAR